MCPTAIRQPHAVVLDEETDTDRSKEEVVVFDEERECVEEIANHRLQQTERDLQETQRHEAKQEHAGPNDDPQTGEERLSCVRFSSG
ncbi:hypothetical protein RF55_4996 [Lasius niger]|uniref:Uncharacterized protein n=1 Tax=Lasius niger TaxID=67767 RepID=A0A0J7KWY7_LASNI|nr:hypothetical protein RF55_4996 [Lasius niger]